MILVTATTCSFHNSPLNAYYKKKRDQGKHHLTATGAVARLTTVIYAVLRDSKNLMNLRSSVKCLVVRLGEFKPARRGGLGC